VLLKDIDNSLSTEKNRNERMSTTRAPKVHLAENSEKFQLKEFQLCKSGQALDQAAQGSGGVPISRGVQKPCRCGTWDMV